jgi:outer membrane protein
MDVVRDQAVVRLRENNVKFLDQELRATNDRFDVGEVTRTDVAQSEARRAGAVAALDLARANLKGSRGVFESTVGVPADGLIEPKLNTGPLPKSVDEAVGIGTQENPAIVGALYREQSARYQVDTIAGELLPTVQLEASYNDRFSRGVGGGLFSSTAQDVQNEVGLVTGRLSVPIYEGGQVYARVRQAKQLHLGRLQDIEQARVQIRAQIISAWAQYVAARSQLESAEAQLEANQVALTGVREEERVGQRTLIEVLNAQQEYLDSQVQVVTTRRNLIVAAYAVQSAVGRLDALSLGTISLVYDPGEYYQDARRKWWGLSITHEDGRRENIDVWPKGGEALK